MQNPEIQDIPRSVLNRYLSMEAEWIDKMFAEHWPSIFSWYARSANARLSKGKRQWLFGRMLTFLFAKLSGLTVHRNKNMEMVKRNGFRNENAIITKSVTVTIRKHDKEVAKAEFQLYG
ncbi:MAG: hypothetical protein V4478_03220 [Patescibacteria group bacterium]